MVQVTEPFWVPGIPGGPYASGQEVELGPVLEAQVIASEKAVEAG